MLPMENVRLTWKGETFDDSKVFKLQNKWRSNTDLPTVLNFQFLCRSVCLREAVN